MDSINESTFDLNKAVETLLYIIIKAPIPDSYHIVKILYFADRLHLEKYGRFISDDIYFKGDYGPVPENLYKLIKFIDGSRKYSEFNYFKDYFDFENGNFVTKKDFNPDYFSKSDFECLDKSIEENGKLTFEQLVQKSHDSFYKSMMNGKLSDEIDMAKTLPNSDALIEYLSQAYC